MNLSRGSALALLTTLLIATAMAGRSGDAAAQQATPAAPPDAPAAPVAADSRGDAAEADAAMPDADAAADEGELTPEERAARKVFSEAAAAAVSGPKDIPIRDQAKLMLPQGFRFIPQREAKAVLELMGNRVGPDFVGMVLPEVTGDEADWLVVVSYEDSGHIADDEAKEWNADELLDGLKKGTEAQNEERRKLGVSEMVVLGWVEPPRYDEATHRLVWSASTKDKAAPGDKPEGINYNTYALGREGYVSLNLVTSYDTIAQDKPVAHQLLAALEFNEGRRYADFNSSTDRLAEFGLAALVGGVAAKKLGLFALIAAFVVKFAKVIGVGALAVAGIGAKWFSGRKKKDGDGGA
jgi:uncharacterized membrane-anchored protein